MLQQQNALEDAAIGKEKSHGSSLLALLREHVRLGLVRSKPRSRRQIRPSLSGETLERRVLLFVLGSRWSTTATSGSDLVQGDATTVTWGIVADGTAIPAMGGVSGESSDSSNLVSFLSGIYGTVTADTNYTDEVWFTHFQSSFDRWSELTGISYVYAAYDDGAAMSSFSSMAPGVLGLRADVRIGGHRIDGNSGTLAYNFYPNNGEMVIDTADSFYSTTTTNSIRLRNTVMHEGAHGFGLDHVISGASGFLMEPITNSAFDGPQFDDILGAQRHYGDAYEKNGGNDTSAKATSLGTLGGGQTLSIGTSTVSTVVLPSAMDFVSIDDELDVDFFSFTTTSAGTVNLQLTPAGPTYNVGPQGGSESSFNASSQSDLTLQLLGTNGTTVLSTANAGGLGVSEAINSFSVPGAGTYYVKVSGSTVNKIQTYRLDITDLASAALTVSVNTGSVSEAAGAGAATGTVTRSGDLTSALVVTLASNDTSEATVPATVTIPAGESSATFAIAAIDDAIVDGTQAVTFTASATSYTSGTINLNVTDNDTQSLVVSSTSVSVTEGATNTFTVKLAFQPASDMTVSVTRASGDTDLSVSGGASLTFTSANWNTTQTVTLAAAEDVDLANGSAVFNVTSTGLTTVSVTGTEADNDTQSLVVSSTSVSITEGLTNTFTVKLAFQPASDVTVSVDRASGDTDLSVSGGASLTFTSANWNTTQTVTLAAAEDLDLANGSAAFNVTSTGLNTVSLSGAEADNDLLTLTVSRSTGSVYETAGVSAATGTVTRNDDDLSSALVVTLSSSDTSEATVPVTVTILAGQSSAAFAISAVDDVVVDGTQVVTFTASATSYVSGTSNLNVTDNELPLPVITGPSAQVSSLRPAISWTASEGATSYDIWIRNQSTNTNPFHTGTSTGTSYTPNVDIGIGKFNLWVRARGPAGNSPWTAQYNFSITTAATLTASDRWQSTSRPTVRWNPLPGAVKYEIWINDHLAGLNPYIRNQNVTETSFTPSSDMPLGLYRTWVRGISADGIAAGWSPMIEFYVAPAPLITGGNLPTFDRTPTFEWQAVTGAVSYEVYVRNSTSGVVVYYPKGVTGTSWTPPADLPDGTYRWWAIAVGANNVRGQWSAPIDIYVGGRPNVLSPVGTVNNSTPTFNWQAVDGAVRYELWVANMSSMVRVIYDTNVTGLSFTPSSSLANAEYRVWVRAVSSTGEFSLWSTTVNFTVAKSNSAEGSLLSDGRRWLVGLEIEDPQLPSALLSRVKHQSADESESSKSMAQQQDANDNYASGRMIPETARGFISSEGYGADICQSDLEKLWERAEDVFTELNDIRKSDDRPQKSHQVSRRRD